MNRRDWLVSALSAPIVVAALPKKPKPLPKKPKLGLLTVKSHLIYRQTQRKFIHVWLNGRDVTDCCYEADDIKGYVKVFKLNANGRPYIDYYYADGKKELAKETLTGIVIYTYEGI